MTMQVTMLQTRMGESGSLLTAGSSYTVSKAFGAMLVGSGYATDTQAALTPPATSLSPADVVVVKALVSGDGIVSTSRAALASDNGGTWELADGVTYTLSGSVALPAGVVLIGPVSGTATLDCTGGATINGGTSSVSITAGQVYSAIPRRTSAVAFVVRGS